MKYIKTYESKKNDKFIRGHVYKYGTYYIYIKHLELDYDNPSKYTHLFLNIYNNRISGFIDTVVSNEFEIQGTLYDFLGKHPELIKDVIKNFEFPNIYGVTPYRKKVVDDFVEEFITDEIYALNDSEELGLL